MSRLFHSPFCALLLAATGLLLFALPVADVTLLRARSTSHEPAASLKRYLDGIEAGNRFDLDEATSRVFHGTQHSDLRYIFLAENWLHALAGRLYAPLRHTQNTDRLVAGRLANCSERAQILKTAAEAAGRRCRFVGLQGHVVLEVWDQGNWRMADPDYGVTFPVGAKTLEKSECELLVRERLGEQGHPTGKIEAYLALLQSGSNNVFMPVGSSLSPRLLAVEVACQWFVWILPMVCLGGALASIALSRTSPADTAPESAKWRSRTRQLPTATPLHGSRFG